MPGRLGGAVEAERAGQRRVELEAERVGVGGRLRVGGGHGCRSYGGSARLGQARVSRPFVQARSYWVETLGCPKNQVDSDKLVGSLEADGLVRAVGPEQADLVVVNTCAFIDAARQESIDAVLALADARRDGARLVVTGCMAERYGDELAEALPEVDLVAGFGVPVTLSPSAARDVARLDLLN
ncbi:MAG: hypothetical protein E6G17_12240, partial [Actinobacteria bacterium]